ncbi:MAG: hypothetical protein OXT67_13525 [Zetaproteobacteria bacterium]|nr:hypothetical protein [Zetaproteobacteria bacterium]
MKVWFALGFLNLAVCSGPSFAGHRSYSIDRVIAKYKDNSNRRSSLKVLKYFTFTARLIAHDKNIANRNKVSQLFEMLDQMKSAGITPNVISYNAAISVCEKAGDRDGALQLLLQMQQGGIRPDEISYNAAIAACEKAGDRDGALQLFENGVHHHIYRESLAHTPTLIDFHIPNWFTPQSVENLVQLGKVNPRHVPGIPSIIAVMILDEAHKKDQLVGKKIITGSHGDGLLTEAVKKYFNKKSYAYSLDTYGTFQVTKKFNLNPYAAPFTPRTDL